MENIVQKITHLLSFLVTLSTKMNNEKWDKKLIFEIFLLSNVIQIVTETMRMTTAIENAETGGRH